MIDGRLLVPAACAWGGVLLTMAISGLGIPGPVVTVGSAAAVACCCAALLVRGLTRARSLVVIGLLACAAGVLTAGLQADARDAEPLATWVQQRATASLEGVVVAEPRRRTFADSAPWQQSSVMEVLVASTRITARGRVIDIERPVLVRLLADQGIPPPGSVVRIVGRLSPTQGPDVVVGMTSRGSVDLLAPPGPIDAAAHAMREGLRAAVSPLDPDAGALVAGLAVGDESGQSDELDAAMRASGLSHLTAVSGGNVSIVVAVVLGLTTLLGLPLLVRVLLSLAGLGFFVVLVGFQPSVLRAAAMGAVVLVSLMAGGRRAGPSIVATAVLVLVLASPSLASSWGFALSVMATAALILVAPRLSEALARWRWTCRWPPAVRLALAVTLAAQAGTAPVLLLMGASIGWAGVPANLLAMPAVPAVTVLGLSSALVSPLAPALAGVLAWLAAWPAGWIAGVAFWASSLPGALLPLPTGIPGVLLLAGVASVAAGGVVMRRRLPQLPRGLAAACMIAGLLLAVLWLAFPPARRAWPPSDWILIMCDVGQGDALLLRSGPQAAVVVDAGPQPDRVDRCLDDAGIVEVPVILLTHFHADHVEGLPGVLRDRVVGQVLVTPLREPGEQVRSVDAWVHGAGLESGVITAGDARIAGAVTWRALWPRRIIAAGSAPNNASIVLDVQVRGRRLLLTGDVEAEAQAALAATVAGARYDVVKVPHHGSRNQAPLPQWAPTGVALVSVGADNPYGHPAPGTLDAWARSGAQVLRTDLAGDIAVVPLGPGVGTVTRR